MASGTLVLVRVAVCVAVGTEAANWVADAAGVADGVTVSSGVMVGKTVAVAAPATAAAVDLTGAAAALRAVVLGTLVEVGSADGVYKGRVVSTAGTTVGASSTSAKLAAGGVPVARCSSLTSIGVARGADSRVASSVIGKAVWVGATLTRFPPSFPSGALSHAGCASRNRTSAHTQTRPANPPVRPPVRRTCNPALRYDL